jgi:hypothetical protein
MILAPGAGAATDVGVARVAATCVRQRGGGAGCLLVLLCLRFASCKADDIRAVCG